MVKGHKGQCACTDGTEGLRKERSSRDADRAAASGLSLSSEMLAQVSPCALPQQWWHRRDRSAGLADPWALLQPRCHQAKQHSAVPNPVRERHFMNPHRPLDRSGSAGQGRRF